MENITLALSNLELNVNKGNSDSTILNPREIVLELVTWLCSKFLEDCLSVTTVLTQIAYYREQTAADHL